MSKILVFGIGLLAGAGLATYYFVATPRAALTAGAQVAPPAAALPPPVAAIAPLAIAPLATAVLPPARARLAGFRIVPLVERCCVVLVALALLSLFVSGVTLL